MSRIGYLAARARRSDAAMLAFFFLWNLLWLHGFLDLPFYGDAAGYVSVHAYNIYLHPWLPFVTGDFDVGHPTLFYWIVALAWRAFGVSVAVGRIVEFAFGALLLLYMYKTGRRLGLGAWAFATALMTSLIPIVAAQTAHFNLDVPYTACFVAATYYFFRKGRPGRFLLFATAMVLIKLTGFILLAPMILLAGYDSIREKGIRDWRSHLRRTWVFGVPLFVLAAFFAARYFATRTVVAKFHSNQIAMSPDVAHLLLQGRLFLRAIAIQNDAYVLAPLIVAGLALGLFRPAARPAKADFSWRRYLVYGLLVFAAYSPPHIMRTLYGPLPRHYMVFLPFVCLASGFALRDIWNWRRPVAPVLYVLLCEVLLVHWHPKYAENVSTPVFRWVLVNPYAWTLGWAGETNFEWADYAKCLKEFGHYYRKKYPNSPPISAVFPELDVIRHPFNGCVEREVEVVPHYAVDDLARWFSQPGRKLYLRGSITPVEYSVDAAVRRVPLRKVKEWHRQRAWYMLFERDPRPASRPVSRPR